MTPNMPSRDDSVTIGGSAVIRCAYCGGATTRTGRRRYCSPACRQAAFRVRTQAPAAAPANPPRAQPSRPVTVYHCVDCDIRSLGQQRCQDCGLFASAIGIGGLCPCCDEPVAYTELSR